MTEGGAEGGRRAQEGVRKLHVTPVEREEGEVMQEGSHEQPAFDYPPDEEYAHLIGITPEDEGAAEPTDERQGAMPQRKRAGAKRRKDFPGFQGQLD